MRRLAEKNILDWKNSSRRKPLIIRGARQVGKTWLVEKFLAKKFDNFVKIDLEQQRSLHKAFQNDLDPLKILETIELTAGRIIPGKTLLFIDEIQACPRAIMALRYFYEQIPELHVVAAGSLLEFAFGEISIPVGRVQYLHLNPMTFYEYLLAIDKETMAEKTLTPQNASELTNEMIFEELKQYFFIGGMPECVKVYRDTHSKIEAFKVQSEIITAYKQDFAKYKPSVNIECLEAVFQQVAISTGEQIKYSRLCDEFSGPTNRKAIDLLFKARLLNKIPACDPSGLPLGASANGKKFKTSMLDIGLLQRLCEVRVDIEIAGNDLLSIYKGKLAEQFVAQEMIAWHNHQLHYWSRNSKSSNAEIDYLTTKDGIIYPIEIKAGKSGKLRSLHSMLDIYSNCPQGWVVSNRKYHELPEQKLVFWPLYATPLLGDRSLLSP
ncbi:MAG: ATP-binding protein [Sedimentisphaeraceae bacterium JB056]